MSDNDGFSEPNPAVPDADDVDEEQIEESPLGGVLVADDTVSCENCAHYDVCGIYERFERSVNDFVQAHDGAEPPTEPDNLAIICDMFDKVESDTDGSQDKGSL